MEVFGQGAAIKSWDQPNPKILECKTLSTFYSSVPTKGDKESPCIVIKQPFNPMAPKSQVTGKVGWSISNTGI